MKPIIKWQYEKLEDTLGLLEEHIADPDCPCSSEGEACPRKHLKRAEAYAAETIAILARSDGHGDEIEKLAEMAEEAKKFRLVEEKKLCGGEIGEDESVSIGWAGNWRKYFENLVVSSCDLAPAYEALVEEVTRMFEEICERPSAKYQYLSMFFAESAPEAVLFITETGKIERKIDTVLAQLESGIAEIHESAKFKDFIDTMAKFHNYSLGNIMLITLQRPGATNVAGYRTWQELGRNVKKSEHGIMILAPCFPPKPKREKEEEDEEEIEPELRPIYFKVVHVFDISQTEGKELPIIEVPVITGEETEPLFQNALTYVAKQGITFSSVPKPKESPDLMGYWNRTDNAIWIRPDAPQDQRTKTLLHEIAHSMCERRGARDAEVMAESVAYTVANHFGYDTGVRSFPYVALWAKDVKVLKGNLEIIRKVARDMIEGIEQVAELSTDTMEVAKMFETECPCKIGIEPEKMSVQAIQDELNALLFDEETWKACDAKDRELLTIIVPRPKAYHFDFLLGKTEWKVRGKWRRPEDDFDIEENVQLDVEFKDAKDECVGKRVIELLKAYNQKVVGEMLLYARTIPIEEGTLGGVAGLQQMTLPTIGGAVLVGVGLRAGGKLIDWVAQKFRKAKKKGDDKEGPIDEEAENQGEDQGEEAGPDESILAGMTRLFEKGGKMASEIKKEVVLTEKEMELLHWCVKKELDKIGQPITPEEIMISDLEGRLASFIALHDKALYARQIPIYVEVWKTTIEKHYHPTMEECQEDSIRVVKPKKDVLVYLCCKVGDDWEPGTATCLPNPSVHKTITPNNPKYMKELEHLKLVHPEIKVNYQTEEVGVEPVVSEEEQKEIETVGKALDNAEVV